MAPLNAQDFGFRPANTGADNRIAWAQAIKEAQEQGKPLYIPAGTYALELTSTESKGAELDHSVTIYGDGPEHTVIDIHPKIVSFSFYVIWWDTADLHVTLKGLKVLGPTGPPDGVFPDRMLDCSFIKGLTRDPFGRDNQLIIDELVVTGKFASAIHIANGDGLVDVRNSDITALSVCVSVFETTNKFLNKRFHADNCRFASGVPATETSNGEAFGICVYLHPHIATRVTNCRFYDNPRDAIKQFGVGAVGHAPKYSQYIGCHFFNCTAYTIITPGEDVVTLIEACSFDQGSIGCRNKTNVIGCEFRNSAGIRSILEHSEDQFEVNIVGCWVHQSAPGIVFNDAPAMSLLVRDCVFSFGEGSREDTAGVSLGQAPYGEVSRCRFVGRTASTTPALAGILLVPHANSRHRVEHCSFAGNFHVAGIAIQPGAEDANGEVNSCDFSQVVGAPMHFNTTSVSFGNAIRGRDNIFNDRAMSTGGVATNMTARLRPRLAMATKPVVALPVEPATVPPTNRIVLDRSYNTFHVRGSIIDSVDIWVSRVEMNKFEGPVHLIADNPWRLTKRGNVRPRTTAPRVVNEVVTLLLDPAKGLWYET